MGTAAVSEKPNPNPLLMCTCRDLPPTANRSAGVPPVKPADHVCRVTCNVPTMHSFVRSEHVGVGDPISRHVYSCNKCGHERIWGYVGR